MARRRRRSIVAVLLALAAIAVVGRWWLTTHLGNSPAGVVLITLDTVRADRLSPYGFMDVSLPHLERLALRRPAGAGGGDDDARLHDRSGIHVSHRHGSSSHHA